MTDTKNPVIDAGGFVVKKGNKFVPGIKIIFDGNEFEGIVEGEEFDTHQECEAFLSVSLPNLVEELCDKLGYRVIRSAFWARNIEGAH